MCLRQRCCVAVCVVNCTVFYESRYPLTNWKRAINYSQCRLLLLYTYICTHTIRYPRGRRTNFCFAETYQTTSKILMTRDCRRQRRKQTRYPRVKWYTCSNYSPFRFGRGDQHEGKLNTTNQEEGNAQYHNRYKFRDRNPDEYFNLLLKVVNEIWVYGKSARNIKNLWKCRWISVVIDNNYFGESDVWKLSKIIFVVYRCFRILNNTTTACLQSITATSYAVNWHTCNIIYLSFW